MEPNPTSNHSNSPDPNQNPAERNKIDDTGMANEIRIAYEGTDTTQGFKTSESLSSQEEMESAQSCFRDFSCLTSPEKLWNTPYKFCQVAARELSVLLILIETLILLGGYLIILGVHLSFKYCFRKFKLKSYLNDRPVYEPNPVRNRFEHVGVPGGVPRRVPRGRMCRG